MPVNVKDGDFVSVRARVLCAEPDNDGEIYIQLRGGGGADDVTTDYIGVGEVLAVLPQQWAIGDKVIDDAGDDGEVIGVHGNKIWVWFPLQECHASFEADELTARS